MLRVQKKILEKTILPAFLSFLLKFFIKKITIKYFAYFSEVIGGFQNIKNGKFLINFEL